MKKVILIGLFALTSGVSIAQSERLNNEPAPKKMCSYNNTLYSVGSIIKDTSDGLLVCRIMDGRDTDVTAGLKVGDTYWDQMPTLKLR